MSWLRVMPRVPLCCKGCSSTIPTCQALEQGRDFDPQACSLAWQEVGRRFRLIFQVLRATRTLLTLSSPQRPVQEVVLASPVLPVPGLHTCRQTMGAVFDDTDSCESAHHTPVCFEAEAETSKLNLTRCPEERSALKPQSPSAAPSPAVPSVSKSLPDETPKRSNCGQELDDLITLVEAWPWQCFQGLLAWGLARLQVVEFRGTRV